MQGRAQHWFKSQTTSQHICEDNSQLYKLKETHIIVKSPGEIQNALGVHFPRPFTTRFQIPMNKPRFEIPISQQHRKADKSQIPKEPSLVKIDQKA